MLFEFITASHHTLWFRLQWCGNPVLEGLIQLGFLSSQADNCFQKDKWDKISTWSIRKPGWIAALKDWALTSQSDSTMLLI